jgi:hypothetical protein
MKLDKTIEEDLDISKIFNVPLDEVIAYLEELKEAYGDKKDVELHQGWYGYEDNYFCIMYTEKETDKEYEDRIAEELNRQFEAEKELQKDKLRKEKQEEIDKLIAEKNSI